MNSLAIHLDEFASSTLTDYKPTTVAFCETKLNFSFECLCIIDDYERIFNSRSGGVIIVDRLSFNLNHNESLRINLPLDSEIYKICVVYAVQAQILNIFCRITLRCSEVMVGGGALCVGISI